MGTVTALSCDFKNIVNLRFLLVGNTRGPRASAVCICQAFPSLKFPVVLSLNLTPVLLLKVTLKQEVYKGGN